MKRIFSIKRSDHILDIGILILRVCIAVFMLIHGFPKLQKLLDNEPIKFANPIGIGEKASLILTVFAEVVCSVFLLLGLATRIAAIPLLFTMLVAVFIVHSGQDFSDKETAILYALCYGVLLISGGGRYSVDRLTGH